MIVPPSTSDFWGKVGLLPVVVKRLNLLDPYAVGDLHDVVNLHDVGDLHDVEDLHALGDLPDVGGLHVVD